MADDSITVGQMVRPGQIDGTGDPLALDQVLFTGAVMAAFQATNKLLGLTKVKELQPGNKGEEFQLIDEVGSAYHTVGKDVLHDDFLDAALTGRRTIFVDRPKITTVFIDSLEDMISDWDSANVHATAIGNELGRSVDKNLVRCLARCARGYITSVYTGEPNNLNIDHATYTTTVTSLTEGVLFAGDSASANTWTAANWLDSVLTAKRNFDDRNFPEEGRILLITNAVMQEIFSNASIEDLIDTDYTTSPNGNVMTGEVGMLFGFRLVKFNNWPEDNHTDQTNYIGGSSYEGNDYRCDMRTAISGTGDVNGSNTISIAFMMPAVGTVRTAGIGIEMHESWRNQGDALLGKYIMGHNGLRPNMAIEIMGRQWDTLMLPKPS